MKNISVSSKSLLDLGLNAYVYFLEHEFDFAALKQVAETLYQPLEFAVKQKGFTGKAGTSLVLSGVKDNKSVYIILLGIGDLKDKGYLNIETYRRAVGQLVRIAENHKILSLGMSIPEPVKFGLSYKKLAEETSTIVHQACYHFDKFITASDRKLSWNFDLSISVSNSVSDQVDNNSNLINEVQDGVDNGICIGHAINQARYWCDMPPSHLTPTVFAEKAKDLAKEYNLKATVLDEKNITELGMGGLAGVSKGSTQECKLTILEYNSEVQDAPTIAIVGKGVTFDSGGLSLKPAAAMETMKDDMAGAAVVLSAMRVIAQFKPKVNVVAVAPMTENMPDGSALKPGDVVTFYNGKTAEILNTDAEGRLILADALSYGVQKYKPDAIIDLATLTGACAAFLGPFYAGLLSQNEGFTEKVFKASDRSGDKVWRLPMDNDYQAAISSPIADMANIGSGKYKAGAITAAFFLKNFVGDTPWVHLDIAGVAFGVPDKSYLRPGATGFGIRLLVDLVMNWEAK